MMRMLLDPENDEQPPEKDNFLELFYGEFMDRLMQPLAEHPPLGDGAMAPCRVRARTLGVIVELLCFCVQHHGYRIKFYVLKNNVIAKVCWCIVWLSSHVVKCIRCVYAAFMVCVYACHQQLCRCSSCWVGGKHGSW